MWDINDRFRRLLLLDLVWRRERKKCFWCGRVTQKYNRKRTPKNLGKRPAADTATFDHIQTRVNHGDDTARNGVLACVECNTERGCSDFVTYGIMVIVRETYRNWRRAA